MPPLLLILLLFFPLASSAENDDQSFKLGWCKQGGLVGSQETANLFATYLSNKLGIPVKPVNVKNDAAVADGIKKGKLHFAVVANYLYRDIAKTSQLMATPFINKSRYFQLYVLTTRSSGINTLTQLKGKKGAMQSTKSPLKCDYLATVTGTTPDKFFQKVSVYEAIKDVLYSVAMGRTDATCISSNIYNVFKKYDPSLVQRLKIIKKSNIYPFHPLVAAKGIESANLDRLYQVLTSMQNDYAAQNVLMKMGVQGFGPPVTTIETYPLRPAPHVPPVVIKAEQNKVIASPISETDQQESSQDISAVTDDTATDENQINNETVNPDEGAAEENPEQIQITDNEQKETQAETITTTVSVVEEKQETPSPVTQEEPKENPEQLEQETSLETVQPTEVIIEEPGEDLSVNINTDPSEETQVTAIEQDPVPTVAVTETVTSTTITPPAQAVTPALQPVNYSDRRPDLLLKIAEAAFLIVLVIMFGLFVLDYLGRKRRRQEATVVSIMGNNLFSMHCRTDKSQTITCTSCKMEPIPDDIGHESFWNRLHSSMKHRKGMNLVGLVPSDRNRILYYTMPFMPVKEIAAAVEWKIKDDNVPYNPENDIIRHVVCSKDKKGNGMTILVQLFSREDVDWLRKGNKWRPQSVISMERCLLSSLHHSNNEDDKEITALVYFFDRDTAVLIIHEYRKKIFSRHIYTTKNYKLPGACDCGDDGCWVSFLPDITQTIDYYQSKSSSKITTLFVAGNEVPEFPDPDGVIEQHTGLQITAVDFLTGVQDTSGSLSSHPEFMILTGAVKSQWMFEK